MSDTNQPNVESLSERLEFTDRQWRKAVEREKYWKDRYFEMAQTLVERFGFKPVVTSKEDEAG